MFEIETWIIGLSLLGAVGYFPTYYLLFQKDFSDRYKKVKIKINVEFKKELKTFSERLDKVLKKDPKEITDFLLEWALKQSVIFDIDEDWLNLTGFFNKIVLCFVGVIIFVAAYLLNTSPISGIYNFLHVSILFLLIEFYYILSFLNNFNNLNTVILKIENGVPIEQVFEKKLKELYNEE
ncbi:hypothetical protein FJY84_04635 [Candidatus Bathyarchaeota archaeon]|nr:hypothetical protein [Candidatus Bathyarchaeota archaeon]